MANEHTGVGTLPFIHSNTHYTTQCTHNTYYSSPIHSHTGHKQWTIHAYTGHKQWTIHAYTGHTVDHTRIHRTNTVAYPR